MIPEEVAAFRDRYRAELIGPRYSGVAHFLFTSFMSFGVIAALLWGVRAPSWREWLTVPIAFLVANCAEYFGHRGPMHHRRRLVGLIFKRHTLEHHRFFTHEAMSYDSKRDLKMVLFPPAVLLFFFGGIGLPLGALAWLLFGENVARLFLAVAFGYYLTYEWLHFSYHLSPDSWLGRRGFIAALRRHHMTHHDPARMATHNFNITFPICDAIFGTSARDATRQD
jgi:hypothetical protein